MLGTRGPPGHQAKGRGAGRKTACCSLCDLCRTQGAEILPGRANRKTLWLLRPVKPTSPQRPTQGGRGGGGPKVETEGRRMTSLRDDFFESFPVYFAEAQRHWGSLSIQ